MPWAAAGAYFFDRSKYALLVLVLDWVPSWIGVLPPEGA